MHGPHTPHRWAQDTLGSIPSAPTTEDITKKSRKVRALERKCAELAARTQRRLEVSAAIRGMTGGGGAQAWAGGRPQSANPSTARTAAGAATAGRAAEAGDVGLGAVPRSNSMREGLWSAREHSRTSAYTAAKMAGAVERTLASLPAPTAFTQQLKSHGMMDALLGGGVLTQNPFLNLNVPPKGGAPAGIPPAGRTRPASASPNSAAATASPGQLGTLTRSGSLTRGRPQSAHAALTAAVGSPNVSAQMYGRSGSMGRGSGVPGTGRISAQQVQEQQAALNALQDDMEQLKEQLDEARGTIQVRTCTHVCLMGGLCVSMRALRYEGGTMRVGGGGRTSRPKYYLCLMIARTV